MTPAEVAYRAVRAIQARAERSGIARERDVPAADLAASPNSWIRKDATVKAETYVEAADRIAIRNTDNDNISWYKFGVF
jgi:hypothetical protein